MAKKREPPLLAFDVYRTADETVCLGRIEAPDRYAALEKAAIEFNRSIWNLYVVECR